MHSPSEKFNDHQPTTPPVSSFSEKQPDIVEISSTSAMSDKFDPSNDIPNLSSKIILITGGTAGLGKGSILELAKHEPEHIFFTGRNEKAASEVIAQVAKVAPSVKTTFIKCDISSFNSVKEAAASFNEQSQRLDILMLNAGIMATPAAVSAEGYEIQFATNHLGHALLVELLLPILRKTAQQPNGDVRIVNMASVAHQQAPKFGIDFATLRSNQDGLGGMIPGAKWSRYGQSKLAQLLYSEQLAKHYPELTSVSIHPGYIMTDLFGNIPLSVKLPALIMSIGKKTPVEEGHWNQCWAATCGKEKLVNGEYYDPIGKIGQRKWKGDEKALGEELWQWTQKELDRHMWWSVYGRPA